MISMSGESGFSIISVGEEGLAGGGTRHPVRWSINFIFVDKKKIIFTLPI